MIFDIVRRTSVTTCAVLVCGSLVLTSACGTSSSGDTDDAVDSGATTTLDAPGVPPSDDTTASTTAEDTTTQASVATSESSVAESPDGCDDIAAQFVTRGSANADLADPEVSASCDGDTVVITSNGIPDYTYIETSPGQPNDGDHTFVIPAIPTMADTVTAVPLLGTAAVSLGGIPIYGPTEGTGGDVESLPGILSDCGSHNGPTGFHIHLVLTSSETDCLFTPEEVATEPQLVGYAFDGFPIYTGADQYTSSWQLTDESLFATDTWAAHTYVEGSGDLDQCNGLTDEEGNYAYYTTSTFPYVLGCYAGVVELEAAGGGGGGGGGGGAGDGADRPDRPERPEGDDADRPERPEPPEGSAGA